VLDALGLGKISVGPPYFEAVFVPLMTPLVVLIGVGPLARWKHAELPDLALTDYTGRTRLWIEVGQPDDKTLSRAASRADAVVLYAYSSAADVWWRGAEAALARQPKLQVWRLPAEQTQALAELAERTMALQATLHDSVLTISSDRGSVSLEPQRWK
jgi:uncharacterized protein YaeQ